MFASTQFWAQTWHTVTGTDLDPQAGGRQLLAVALVQAVLPHQRGEMLQTVGVALGGGDVQEVVSILVPDQFQVVCRQVRLRRRRGGGGDAGEEGSAEDAC